ncbi:hypothetical protein GCM10023191_071010 [Actinoallomurus oryzae]|uniref:Uncharacterized protein n=1 Tax=Actinoallomurus oryzae TaxID=502180 RepID=A0ABP8QSD1_9ACTN
MLTRVFGFGDAGTLRYSAQVERTGEPLLLAGLDVPYMGTPVPEEVPMAVQAGAVVPSHVHTDGWWIWSEALAYYAWRYGIAPEPEFLRHIRARGYRYPEVARAALDRAAAMVRSPEHRPRARPGGPLRMDPERRRRLVEPDRRQRECTERRRANPPED